MWILISSRLQCCNTLTGLNGAAGCLRDSQLSKAQKTSKGDRSFLGAMVFSICFMGVLAYSYTFLDEVIESVTSSTIRASTESSHGDMVLVASQSLRQEIETLITAYEAVDDNVDWPQFSRAPVFIDFDRKVRALVARTKVVKLKLYADDSITIYSSNPSEIGVEKSEVEQVTHALRAQQRRPARAAAEGGPHGRRAHRICRFAGWQVLGRDAATADGASRQHR